MKTASFSIAILSFFSRHGQYFHPTKDQPRTRPSSTFLYICCNFGQIFCTNVIHFFSVQNMGHNQLQKCSKYHLVSFLNEKQRSTFAIFLHLFYPCPLLTNSALFDFRSILAHRWNLKPLSTFLVKVSLLILPKIIYTRPIFIPHLGAAKIFHLIFFSRFSSKKN